MMVGDQSGPSTGSIGLVALAIPAALIVVPLGILGFMVYKANQEPPEPEDPEAVRRLVQAGKTSGTYGMATEALVEAKRKKTLKTPLGIRVPNLARYILPEEGQIRAASSAYADLKGQQAGKI
jgi:hypothetical protein